MGLKLFTLCKRRLNDIILKMLKKVNNFCIYTLLEVHWDSVARNDVLDPKGIGVSLIEIIPPNKQGQ